jgi:DNA-binding transcriptional MerR regulator
MDNPTNNPETPYFEVGAVSKITKLSPNTLRTWERRKFIEASSRSATGRRRYSQEQVEILVFLKKLTNLGDAISSIAHLPLSELRSRLLEYQTQNTEAASKRSSMVKVLPVGNQAKTWASILPTQFKTISNTEQNPDILLIDLDAPQVDCKRRVTLAAYEHPNTPIALIYDYAPREIIQQFSNEGKFLIHIPCSPELLVHYVHAAMANATHQNAPTTETTGGFPSPPRLFSDKQLATLASSNPNIKCECPHHISALVASLASFENYCRRCEAESPKDAEVHSYLGKEISRARSIVEDALLYLCEKDNLVVPTD